MSRVISANYILPIGFPIHRSKEECERERGNFVSKLRIRTPTAAQSKCESCDGKFTHFISIKCQKNLFLVENSFARPHPLFRSVSFGDFIDLIKLPLGMLVCSE